MAEERKLTTVQKLRAYVAHLEQENRMLRGQEVPSAAAVALRRGNAELRRRLDAALPEPAAAARDEFLTVPQVAHLLNTSTYDVLRSLRDSLPMAVDDDGNTVVAKADVDAYLLARTQGRPTQRFV